MAWLTPEEREQNERERPERERRARETFAELTRDASCPACKSRDLELPTMNGYDESSVKFNTRLRCRACKCEWYPGRVK